MCEHTYVGCPGCETDCESIRFREIRSEVIRYRLDSDGDIVHGDEPDYDEEPDCQGDGYECMNCGWYGSALAEGLSNEDCECLECEEPDPSEAGEDPDRLVTLVRERHDIQPEVQPDWPKELCLLANDRSIYFLPMPRWRASEIWSEHLEHDHFPFNIDFDELDPNSRAVRELMFEYGDQPELPKGANADGHVATCA